MNLVDKKIIIWGLSGVGKTTFIHALPREMSMFPNVGLRFNLEGDLPVMAPTEFGEDLNYQFQISKVESGELIREYALSLYDDKGDAMKSALEDIDSNSIILSYIKSAKGIIVLIDPTLVLNDLNHKRELVKLIQNLIKLLRQRRDCPSVAICMNKMDLIDARWKDPEKYFEICFDSAWREIKGNILSSKNVDFRLFLVSAAGFVHDGLCREYSNFLNNNIAAKDGWRPWNVSAPFFWIFSHFDEPQMKPWYSSLWQNDIDENTYPLPFY
jgi:GTPase SAR1 family protein